MYWTLTGATIGGQSEDWRNASFPKYQKLEPPYQM